MPDSAKKERDGPLKLVSDLLGMPQSTIDPRALHIEMQQNHEAVLEGITSVLEYSESTIKLAAGAMTVKLNGRNLSIGVLERRGTLVKGYITSVEFMR